MPEDATTVQAKSEFRPSAYMRAQRPELFSDSVTLQVAKLDRSYFEYHLETLTTRKQEQEFEEFCRRLVQLEICPNIKPQTGPTGGGDSKTDASTYPVSPSLAARAWYGTPNPPSEELWAFAFSCKKAWRQKLRDDVKAIAGLQRRFAKVYFITNQAVRDKARAAEETQLGGQHGFEVHVLDRSWLLKVVIEHKRQAIAEEVLRCSSFADISEPGPQDLTRARRLEELMQGLANPLENYSTDYALAHDYHQAAILSRALEKPRHEVEGLFQRSRDIARQHGYEPQIIRFGYDHAWTALWWYDDYAMLERIYGEMEVYLIGIQSADLCELFANLWRLLAGAVLHRQLDRGKARLDERLAQIRQELERLAIDRLRPNNALQARTELHLLDLHLSLEDPTRAGPAFKGLKACLRKSQSLGTYPALEFVDVISKSGEFFGELPGYDELFNDVRAVFRKRLDETADGRLLHNRAIQLGRKNQPREALRMLGEARVKLFKQETMRECLWATLGCALAYMDMGLYWAARLDALTAVHGAMATPERFDEFPEECLSAVLTMGWAELALARVPSFLAWYRLARQLVPRAEHRGVDIPVYIERLEAQEAVLGCLFLNLSEADASALVGILQSLEEMGLPMARRALLFSQGERAQIEREWPSGSLASSLDIDEYFAWWKSQPASQQVRHRLPPFDGPYVLLDTTVMGVRYIIRTRNLVGPARFAENLLGILESALATADWRNLAFIVDEQEILVDIDEAGSNPPQLESLRPPAPPTLRAIWKPDMNDWLVNTKRKDVSEYFMQTLLLLLFAVTIDPLDDLHQELKRWHTEHAFDRAIGTSPIAIQLTDLFGKDHHDVEYWRARTHTQAPQ